jgi:CBS domain-containing protein
MYPVTDNGQVHGCVTISDIKAIPREQWPARSVRDIAGPCSEANTVRPTEDAMQALSKMNRTGVSRLLVIDDGRLVGILSLKDLLRFLSVKTDLEK